jgi:hypothetical protein
MFAHYFLIMEQHMFMGRVLDAENKLPLLGVNVYLKGQNIGAATDLEGNFKIEKLPVGNYVLVYSYIGYTAVTVTDLIIRSDRITYRDTELYTSSVDYDSIVVSGGFFSNTEIQPISAIEYSAEEIRRAPGSAGDISRILFGLPSVAKVNDGKSSFMVRGGSPVENAFYLDNIEISNINHFATAGSSDGLFGILNIDFVKNVTFNAGGFSPVYGDRLSSVMEISFREGNRNEYDAQVNINFGGAGAQFEGPFAGKNGSFLFAVNKSYLDLLMNTFAKGYPAPEYYDAQTKVVYDLSDKHKLSFIDIFAHDIYNVTYDEGFKNEFNQYGNTKYITNTAGINWMFIWGQSGYSNTSLSHTYNYWDVLFNNTNSRNKFMTNNSVENDFRFRNVNFYKINKDNKLDFGFEAKLDRNNFDYTFYDYLDEYGNVQNTATTSGKLNTFNGSGFLMHHLTFLENITLSSGGRINYISYNDRMLYSPRGILTYRLNPLTSISASAGIFYQNIPSLVLAQSDEFKKLKTPKAVHYILSLNHLLTEDTKLTIELYQKDYSNLLVDPEQSKDFLFDQVVSSGLFTNHSSLLDIGKARSKGIEVIIQKKLAKDFYGMASTSYSSAQFRDMEGRWWDRIYDNRYNFNIEGGYKPDSEWEFSLRFIYAGGAPYTPFNSELSRQNNRGILDLENINNRRLPDYHSLNLRVDRRFHFSKSNLVVFLSIWNVYNRNNISAYIWNEVKNQIAEDVGWNTIPVFGIEYEF